MFLVKFSARQTRPGLEPPMRSRPCRSRWRGADASER